MLLAGAAISQSAIAQDNVAGANNDGDGGNDIIVITQKREQSPLDVPLSVQALGGEALDRAAIRYLSEIMTVVPGASEELSTNAGFRRYQLRGIAQGPGDQIIGYYIDDSLFVLYGLTVAPVGRIFDMDCVRVLRGHRRHLGCEHQL